ncbi:MAG: histidinol-phosphatase HisJ family protein [Lachnospiraceae bacterium]|nr:histidinol-phosphatase HisJ family protein [Lachnospiraceae bacterium]
MLCDCHLHSRFSADSEAEPGDILKTAKELSMPAFCITDHLDFDYPYDEDFELDMDRYYPFWSGIRETASGELPHSLESSPGVGNSSSLSEEINLSGFAPSPQKEASVLASPYPEVLIGMETGLEPGYEGRLSEAVHRYPWDFIIGSTHLVHRRDPYFSSYYAGRTEAAAYREYFESILETLDFCRDFDVYGHIDYVVRYGPNKNRFYSYESYADVLDAILRKLISMGKGIELNTGGYLKGLGVPNPAPEVIRRYRELGGEIITVGSDAHNAALVGHHFKEAREVLLDAGFRFYCIFRKRKPVFLPIS